MTVTYCYRLYQLVQQQLQRERLKHNTMEPRYNEPLYNEVLGTTNDFPYPSNCKIHLKKSLDISKPRYSEQILPVPRYVIKFNI